MVSIQMTTLKTIKCWLLDGSITYEECEWIRKIGARVEITGSEYEDFNYHGTAYKLFKSQGSIKIYTENEESETLLLLKYSECIQLLEWAIDIGECTLSEVNIETYDAKTW